MRATMLKPRPLILRGIEAHPALQQMLGWNGRFGVLAGTLGKCLHIIAWLILNLLGQSWKIHVLF